MAAPSTAWLGTGLPPLAATQVYVLLEAGALRPCADLRQPATIQARFRVDDEAASNLPGTPGQIVECPVAFHRAGLLIPGTRWSAAGWLLPASPLLVAPATRTLSLLVSRLIARRLYHLFPAAARPVLLMPYSLHGWYLPVETETECLLLPCFEVARAFFYASGPRVISYCLSRLALERICWPLVAPDATSHQTAHYSIAAHTLRAAEIRLFAELVFNAHCRQTIQRAHARLAQDWTQLSSRRGQRAPWLRLDWELGRSVRLQVRGEPFNWQGTAYFLVHSLVPAPDWFSYRKVVCHLLAQASQVSQQPLFSTPVPVLPVATMLFPTASVALREQVAVEDATTLLAPPVRGTAPPILRAGCWASASQITSPAGCYPTTQSIRAYLWEGCLQMTHFFAAQRPASLAGRLPRLASLMAHLAPYLQAVRPVELHNPQQLHGRGVSVFPPGSLPSAHTHLPDRHLRPLGVLHLQQGGAHFYLFHLGEDKPPVLVYELRLGVLSTRELQQFLYQFSYAGQAGEQVDRALFDLTHQVYAFCRYPPLEASLALPSIRDWCLAQIRWGICRYNAYRYLLRQPDQVATRFEPLRRQLQAFHLAERYLERGYLHFPGREVAELPDAAQF